MVPEIISIQRTESQSSYEFGKSTNRFKLYFSTTDELKTKIKELVVLGLIEENPLKE